MQCEREWTVMAYAACVPDDERCAFCETRAEAIEVRDVMRRRFPTATVRLTTHEYYPPLEPIPSAPPSDRKAALAEAQGAS